MTMSLERRLAVLKWPSRTGAFIIENDYDSQRKSFRRRPPLPALQPRPQFEGHLHGSFHKLLFPTLRVGYVILPPPLVDLLLAFRCPIDFHNLSADQTVLCDL